MAATRADLVRRLDELGIKTVTTEHPPLFTVEQSRALRGEIAGGHSKNLFLKDKKDRIYLVVAEEETPIDMKGLHRQIGSARLSFGKPELLDEVLGVIPGAVTPFALINDTGHRVDLVLDASLMRHDMLNFHPLDNSATTTIAREDLLTFLKANGHEPLIMDLAAGDGAD
ncbi:MAG TPA: prolyl-tRNA synthetase associated domain-containing protein [Afifellaceae bacterium]|nr:prolyl-tRNA synthetase associated domain-containing protein [Afifellaceae bacterium]